MRNLAVIVLATLAHLAVSVGLFFVSFGMSMGRMDDGEPASVLERVLDFFTTVLLYPLVTPAVRWGSGLPVGSGHALFVANSLVWGVGLWLLFRALRTRRGRPVPV
ncbi:MAG TPA: hypothetical protein VF263_10815 [Longimicrobiaceae bacterium]